LGDLVGYGGDPEAVVDRVMDLAEQGAWVVSGNHDQMALRPPTETQREGDSGAAWTHAQLRPDQLRFLEGLPLTQVVGPMLLVHASALHPERWYYVDDVGAAARSLEAAVQAHDSRYVFGGHVHRQALYYQGAGGRLVVFQPQPGVSIPVPSHRRWLGTVGSVGQPRDGDVRAMYAGLDLERGQLRFFRVPYDHVAAAASIRRAGLPERYAQRLLEGT
jgi:diadenosine tetraphosphatase ApaH/serine/threonine PP2A family protein phosphatase